MFSILALALGCATITPGVAVVQVDVCGTQAEETRYSVIHGGRVISGPCSDYYWIPTREQREMWDGDQEISFSGVDGQSLSADVALRYQVSAEDADVIKMVRTYGPDLTVTIDGRVRDSVRNGLNMCAADLKMSVQDIYGTRKGELFKCVQERVSSEYAPNGLLIGEITLNSEIRLPEQVAEAMAKAQAATQNADRARREVESTLAEGEKRVAAAKAEAEAVLTRAQAEAEANRIISASLTPEVLKMRQLEIELKRAEKWDGAMPVTVLGGDTPVIWDLK